MPVGTTADGWAYGYRGDPSEDSPKLLGDSWGCIQMSTDSDRQSGHKHQPAGNPPWKVRSQGAPGEEGEGAQQEEGAGRLPFPARTKQSGSCCSGAFWGPAKSICHKEAQVSHHASH